jgi:hypothetical protein
VFSIKALAVATAVSAGVVLGMPATGEAAQVKSKVHVQTGSNLEQKKSASWWRRHCQISNDVKCGREYTRRHNDKYYGKYRKKSGVNITID